MMSIGLQTSTPAVRVHHQRLRCNNIRLQLRRIQEIAQQANPILDQVENKARPLLPHRSSARVRCTQVLGQLRDLWILVPQKWLVPIKLKRVQDV